MDIHFHKRTPSGGNAHGLTRLLTCLAVLLVAAVLTGCGSGAGSSSIAQGPPADSGQGASAGSDQGSPDGAGSGSADASAPPSEAPSGDAPSGDAPSGGDNTGAYVPPSAASDNLNEVINGNGQENSQVPSADSLPAFMTAVIKDVAVDWNARFQSAGRSYTFPQYDWVNGSDVVQAVQCGAVAGDPDLNQGADPAFACPGNLTVYLSIQWVNDNLWQPHLDKQTGQVDTGGTMAVGVTIAHEMTHIAQFELGIKPPPGSADVSSTELQADCGAGVWANDKYYSGQLQPGDIQVAEQTLTGLGDFEFGSQQHHGTPNQRREAFDLGYNSGQMSDCTLDLPASLPL